VPVAGQASALASARHSPASHLAARVCGTFMSALHDPDQRSFSVGRLANSAFDNYLMAGGLAAPQR
ncbi:hypothetical protein RZS08_28070, partial [Arthrospira platensis SPKY1]|nr:hypothetical protein [Arthrospira platensis SPKY1]